MLGVVLVELVHDEDTLPPPREGDSQDLLGEAVLVVGRGVDEVEPQVQRLRHGGDAGVEPEVPVRHVADPERGGGEAGAPQASPWLECPFRGAHGRKS